MITKCRYSVFDKNHEPHAELRELLELLRSNGIKLDEESNSWRRDFAVYFDVTDASAKYREIQETVDRIKSLDYVDVLEHHSVSFSEQELDAAKYLSVRSVYSGIMVQNRYIELQHDSGIRESLFGFKNPLIAYEHVVQIDNPRINKGASWRKDRQFCSNYESTMRHLFCSDLARSVIETNHLEGAEFRPVYHYKKGEQIPDLWQLYPHECEDFLTPGNRTKTRLCPVCGARRYVTTDERDRLCLIEDKLPEGYDFFQSPPLVGARTGHPFYVVSGRVYQVLKKADIIRALIFEPLEVVSHE